MTSAFVFAAEVGPHDHMNAGTPVRRITLRSITASTSPAGRMPNIWGKGGVAEFASGTAPSSRSREKQRRSRIERPNPQSTIRNPQSERYGWPATFTGTLLPVVVPLPSPPHPQQ